MPNVIHEMGGVSADGYIVGPEFAVIWQALRKVVLSRTLEEVDMTHIPRTTAAVRTQ